MSEWFRSKEYAFCNSFALIRRFLAISVLTGAPTFKLAAASAAAAAAAVAALPALPVVLFWVGWSLSLLRAAKTAILSSAAHLHRSGHHPRRRRRRQVKDKLVHYNK